MCHVQHLLRQIDHFFLEQIKRKTWKLLQIYINCSHLSVAHSYGSTSHHVVRLKFVCERGQKQSEMTDNGSYVVRPVFVISREVKSQTLSSP